MFEDFKAWLLIADAALPRNFLGYLITLCLSPLRADPFTTTPYDSPKEIAKCGQDLGRKSFLPGPLPEREGPRPEMAKWMAPHRQVSQRAGEDMHQLLQETITTLVTHHSPTIVERTSILEKRGPALHLGDNIATPHAIAKATKREIVHVHSDDHSLHLCLSPVDCKEVIGKGWGERMTLAGSLMPEEYLLVYAPRTVEEVRVVGGIVGAAVGFMTEGVEGVGK